MIPAHVHLALTACVLVFGVGAAHAQAVPDTLREATARAGFTEAAQGHGARFLDEPLSSWTFGTSGDLFAVGYYLQAELDGEVLGPLRISVFDRSTAWWRHAGSVEVSGSVLRVQITPAHLVLDLHLSPSAGRALVLDRRTLEPVRILEGFWARPIAGGRILFIASMTHFAPTHQMRLMAYNPATRREVEVFPGAQPSQHASAARQAAIEAFKRLPAPQREPLEQSVYGGVEDIDRTIRPLQDAPDGRTIGFVVTYRSDRLTYTSVGSIDASPIVRTAVRCTVDDADGWQCAEGTLEAVADRFGITLRREGRDIVREDLDALVRAMLQEEQRD